MKFIVETFAKCTPRLGVINDFHRIPDLKIETPGLFLHTKGGHIPHITREVFNFITNETHCLQVPLSNTITFNESLKETDCSLAEFVGMSNCLLYITIKDPVEIVSGGHHLQNNIPIWTRSGKMYLTTDSYMDTIESFKPDIYCLLSDNDTNKISSKKRISKSVDQTLSFVSKCLERHDNSTKLKNSKLIASIEGGYCLQSRDRCLKSLLENNDRFSGYLINGLGTSGPDMESLSFDDVKVVVDHIIKQLPEDKIRIIEGCWNPVNVIKLMELGADIFDTSYINLVTERACALTFNLDYKDTENKNIYEINMKDEKYAEDFEPLMKHCTCLTCRKYTKAYLHHLINVQELLGPILLTIHNTHHYIEFFKLVRECIKQGTLKDLENSVKDQYDSREIILYKKDKKINCVSIIQ